MSIDNDKFQFVGELKSSRICHGCVAVAFSLSSAGRYLVFDSSDLSIETMELFCIYVLHCF